MQPLRVKSFYFPQFCGALVISPPGLQIQVASGGGGGGGGSFFPC